MRGGTTTSSRFAAAAEVGVHCYNASADNRHAPNSALGPSLSARLFSSTTLTDILCQEYLKDVYCLVVLLLDLTKKEKEKIQASLDCLD